MGNVLEFLLKLNDLVSPGMKAAANVVDSTTARMAKDFRDVYSTSKLMNNSLSDLKNRLNSVKQVRAGTVLADEFKAATKEAKILERQIKSMEGTRRGGGGLLGGLGGFARPLLAAASIGSLLSIGNQSVKAANQFEAQKTSYQVLAQNNAIGGQVAGDLRGLKENTILGPAVYQSAQVLMGYGVSAKEVSKDVRMLGEVSMGNAEKLQHLTLAFAEVSANGRLTGKEMRQFVNAGFNPLKEISDKTGKSMEVLREEMKKGAISAGMVKQAFESATGPGGRFYDMLNRMAETGAGKLQMLEGRVASLKIAFGERLQPAMNAVVDKLIDLATWAKHFVEVPLADKLTDQISSIRGLQAQMNASNTTEKDRLNILKQLEEINPNIVKGINSQSIEYSKLNDNITNVITSLKSKIFVEQFNKENAGIFSKFAEAQKTYATESARATAIAANVLPGDAQSGKLTVGQLQSKAAQELLRRVSAEPNTQEANLWGIQGLPYHRNTKMFTNSKGVTFRLNGLSDDNTQLIHYQQSMRAANEAFGVMNALRPQVEGMNKTRDALLSQFDKYAGTASMVNAQKNKPTGVNPNSFDDLDSTVKGKSDSINSGGNRPIIINVQKQIETLNMYAGGAREGAVQIAEAIREELRRMLKSINSGKNN